MVSSEVRWEVLSQMKKINLCIIAIFLFGCTTTTTIELPEGDMITVKSKNGSLVRVSRASTKIEVDNRGRASFLEQLISMIFMKADWITHRMED